MHPRRKGCAIHGTIGIRGLLLVKSVVILTPPILGCLLLLLILSIVLKPVGKGVGRHPRTVVCIGLLLLLRLRLPPQRPVLGILLLAIQVDLLRRRHTVPVLVCPPSVIRCLLRSILRLSLLHSPVGGCLSPGWSRLEVQRRLSEIVRLLPGRLLPAGGLRPPGTRLTILLHRFLWLPRSCLLGVLLALFKLLTR